MSSIPPPSGLSGYLRWSTGVIAAIALLVCMVSLPRLQNYVQCNNEEDAARSLRVLGRAGSPQESPDLATWIGQDRSLRHRFLDARVLEDSGLLMQHGYLFQMQRPEGLPAQFVAWPRSAPRTGQAAFMWDGSGNVLRHANADGRWNGPEARPAEPGTNLSELGWAPWVMR
ncbi:MAG TPA: hypothetical protein EYQ74_02915 [Planctomycetes bacterium]|nr:hypothetical protein [Planctomycetota bacterium]HIK62219.1 hypothetical protein [Planctomycetota bacterium]